MPGISKNQRKHNEALQKAREIQHPHLQNMPEITPEPPIRNQQDSSNSGPVLPNSQRTVMVEDVTDEEDLMHVSGIDEMVTRFVALEEEGQALVWVPNPDEDADEEEYRATSQQLDIEAFAVTMQRLHDEELARAQERRKFNNRSKGYSKNSAKTLKRQRDKRQKYAAGGGKFISDFFSWKKQKADDGQAVNIEPESEDESEIELVETEVTGSEQNITIEAVPEPISPTLSAQALDFSSSSPEDARTHLETLKASAQNARKRLEDLESAERALSALTWKDRPALRKAVAGLALKAKDKKLDVFLRARITAMVATINFYLDEELKCTWELAAKGTNRKPNHARNL
ncbi:hypothetical protein MPER_12298 [Moniliophthora perniciosa FA553]|nr:hypothetical protein MPER_12298 [Moniliophthora perniciosa FA553]